jgi:hypothetical protein
MMETISQGWTGPIHEFGTARCCSKNGPRRRIQWLVVVTFAVALAGFPLIALLPPLFNVESRVITVPFRAFCVFFSCVVLAVYGIYRNHLVRGWYWFGVTMLWALLLIRMTFDLIIHPIATVIPSSDYWPMALGLSLVLPLSLAVVGTRETYTIGRRICFPLVCIAAVLIAGTGLRSYSSSAYSEGRLGTEVLNPISIGQLGASLVILSLSGPLLKRRWLDVTLRIVSSGVGVMMTLLTNARGAQGALFICILLLMIKAGRKPFIILILSVVCLAYPFIQVVDMVESSTQIRVFGRWSETIDPTQTTSAGFRIVLLQRAFQQFLEHPVTGNAMVEVESGLYPHNIVAEAFMATGIMGGVVLLGLLVFGCRCANKLVSSGPAYRWIGLLYFQVVVASMLSGSLLADNSFWIWSHAAVAAFAAVRRDRMRPVRPVMKRWVRGN